MPTDPAQPDLSAFTELVEARQVLARGQLALACTEIARCTAARYPAAASIVLRLDQDTDRLRFARELLDRTGAQLFDPTDLDFAAFMDTVDDVLLPERLPELTPRAGDNRLVAPLEVLRHHATRYSFDAALDDRITAERALETAAGQELANRIRARYPDALAIFVEWGEDAARFAGIDLGPAWSSLYPEASDFETELFLEDVHYLTEHLDRRTFPLRIGQQGRMRFTLDELADPHGPAETYGSLA